MNSDLTKAVETLESGAYTCVLCKGDRLYTATERGVRPLLLWLHDGTDLKGFAAADKVVGKAAALLYVLLGVRSVYAHVMSKAALETLAKNSIDVHCDRTVEHIMNRAGTGLCPMEETVMDIDDPQKAKERIVARLNAMHG